jgi:D-alanyl-D-alanine carboxypeptidase
MRLQYLALSFSLLVLATLLFLANSKKNFSAASVPSIELHAETPAPSVVTLPILSEDSGFPIISAQSAYVRDLDSRQVLYEKDSDNPHLPASTAKMVTALVAMSYYPEDTVLTVGEFSVDGQKMGLQEGEEITVEDLLYGLLIYSANDAAEVLARNFPGGREFFITSMNSKVKDLGLEKTYFTNPAGLDGKGQVTTARELVQVAEYAMQNDRFAEIVGMKEKTVTSIDGGFLHELENTNELLGEVPGVLGVKTGWTASARENLVVYINRDGRRIMVALMGSQDRFGEAKELIGWIFENYQWLEVVIPAYSP